MNLKILYQDNHLIFVEKPVNMPVQADSSGDFDLLSALKAYIKEEFGKPGEVYLGMVHRLDRPVGGVMVFCKTSKAAARISRQISENETGKEYLAVVRGNPPGRAELADFLVKDEKSNMVSVCQRDTPGAKEARLSFETIARKDGLSLVKVNLHTGRPHQIRVQMSAAGFPIWGDARYGGGKAGQQIALWSHSFSLVHPTLKEEIRVTCEPPADFPWNCFL